MADAVARYKSGQIKATQDRADRNYRRRQRELRTWVDQVAGELGLSRDQLLTARNAELVAQLLKNHNPG
ncbi:hypothetical protein CUROG_04550 [Corynebacterium urogenitale]|uniref:Uncharacterized protein n=1 Tax=Corynebacterium urogenitale TaxID=2487892 RepID=A0A5J6Z9A2_9CORY|nr:hypothetical protein CUROG_04550 [Corynebacterium urogenitale]